MGYHPANSTRECPRKRTIPRGWGEPRREERGASDNPPARAPPDADTGPWTRELCDDVDPMPDYENVLTD